MFPSGVLHHTEIPNLDGPTIPICDIPDPSPYSKQETKLRNELASLYRLVDRLKWSQSIFNHMTVRVPTEDESDAILINPFGLFYREITSSSLIKVDLHGNVLDQGTTNLAVNQAGYVLHSSLHESRREIQAIIHLHIPSVAAVSSMQCGLLPLCQESMIIGPVAYHDYQGILVDECEKKSLVEDLGDKNVMILRNHGFVVCGRTVPEAFSMIYHLVLACETQVRAMAAGIDRLIIPTKEAAEKAYQVARNGAGGVNRISGKVDSSKWGCGELEWQAWMRVLDSLGLRTNYEYR